MKAVLDACVLYPTVLREILLGVARAGLFTPVWSARLLEEWARAAARSGPQVEAEARAAAALLTAAFPRASVPPHAGVEARIVLPDPNDAHVLATAIAAGADAIVTFNRADFPRGILAGEGVERRDPDGFLWQIWSHHPTAVGAAVRAVQAEAERLSGRPQPLRALLKRAGLPRLGKAMAG